MTDPDTKDDAPGVAWHMDYSKLSEAITQVKKALQKQDLTYGQAEDVLNNILQELRQNERSHPLN